MSTKDQSDVFKGMLSYKIVVPHSVEGGRDAQGIRSCPSLSITALWESFPTSENSVDKSRPVSPGHLHSGGSQTWGKESEGRLLEI